MAESSADFYTELCQERRVLDKGSVRLISVMGEDIDIVRAAKVCTCGDNEFDGDPTNLIRYLMRHGHTTPFEMAELKFYIKAPMDVWRQWVRHRTASINEVSTRYKEVGEDVYPVTTSLYRCQSDSVKQGSVGNITPGSELHNDLQKLEETAYFAATNAYEEMTWRGVAKEQARKVLPLATYTEAYWKIDLHNLLHFLYLRTQPGAQWEIRQYAIEIAKIVSALFPVTWKAFVDYKLNSITFSAEEAKVLQHFLKNLDIVWDDRFAESVTVGDLPGLSKGEKEEFKAKLEKFWNCNDCRQTEKRK